MNFRNKILFVFSMVYGWFNSHLPKLSGERGGIITGIIMTIMAIVVVGVLLPALWPMMQESSTNIAAINGTDTATGFLKTGWPIAIFLVGVGIVIALIYFALRQFGVIGGGKRGGGL